VVSNKYHPDYDTDYKDNDVGNIDEVPEISNKPVKALHTCPHTIKK
jgi:hypothetical protein